MLKEFWRGSVRVGITVVIWVLLSSVTKAQDCNGSCTNAQSFLSEADVSRILSQAVQEARAHNVLATIAVVDRVGNVLAVYRMGDKLDHEVLIATSPTGNNTSAIDSGLEGIILPTEAAALVIDDQAAISKAITGAYLSSEGNAFTTRTASQIIQENFNPGEINQPGGPLFGVQFSQLACSDFTQASDGTSVSAGPQRSPLGLSADPGGLPLYKEGSLVGGIGVIADGLYSIDKDITDFDYSIDELISLAGTIGFSAPIDRRANRITVEGKTLRFSDMSSQQLLSSPQAAPSIDTLAAEIGALAAVFGYTDGTIKAGVAFGSIASGIRPDERGDYPGLDAFVFVDNNNVERYPPTAGSDNMSLAGLALSEHEVRVILQEALRVANRARAQIRRPLGSQARVSVAVVDTNGEVLGMVRTRDAPIFGSDVALQKARTAAFYSSADAAEFLRSLPNVNYLNVDDDGLSLKQPVEFSDYVTQLQVFMNDASALTDGFYAFSDRAGGNLSRRIYPDGLAAGPSGPLSKPTGSQSVFSTGLQLDLVYNGILQHILAVASDGLVDDVPSGCAGIGFSFDAPFFTPGPVDSPLPSGIQIFPGSVPIFRGETLIGGIGVSGDGVDQDDMISFLGVHNAGEVLGGEIGNAPVDRRADNLAPQGIRLRFIQCPLAPFLDSRESNVCENK
ncbi:MAG: hypothetical protein DHS20C12_26110 [Pseudohongiella sp.]|nr:MAG: hypothetical protein DHS20C12_26110 [Pseudohongiella sp.]